MKLVRILSIVLICSSFLFSCDKKEPVSGWKKTIDSVNQSAFDYRYKNIDSSKIKSYEAIALINEYDSSYYDAKARAWNTLAYAFFLTSDFDVARTYMDSVRQLKKDYANKEMEETISNTIEARLLLRECKYVEAFSIYDSAITIFDKSVKNLKYAGWFPAKYDEKRYYWAKSEYLTGNAILNYYYRNNDLFVIMNYLREAEKDKRLYVDTTQLSILYYTFAGAYEESIHDHPKNLNKTLEYVEKGLALLSDPQTRNDYYLANNYQILGNILINNSTSKWTAQNGSIGKKIERVKEEYLVARYGWKEEDVKSDTLALLLYKKSDSLFRCYRDPYQNMASAYHIGRYYLQRGDTLQAKKYFYACIEPDAVLQGNALRWKRDVYNALLSTLTPEENTISQVKKWYGIYEETSDIIAQNTRVDYQMQQENEKNKSDSRRSKYIAWVIVVLLIFTVIFLYQSIKQNRKLQKVQVDLKTRNRELEESQSNLEFMQQKLIEQKRMELLTYVVRGISHELSQPLGTITQTLFNTMDAVCYVKAERETLKKEELETQMDDIISDLKMISQSKEIITDLIKSFRNIIKENIVDSETEFGLKQRIEDIVKIIRPSIKSNIELLVDCDEHLVVRSFPLLLGQVMTNLIANANQHAFPHANEYNNTIRISCRADGNDLLIQCADNGIGIPENELEKLCQPFVSKTNTNLGLGLFLIKNIVEQYMNGSILFASDQGLSVTIIIPHCIIKK